MRLKNTLFLSLLLAVLLTGFLLALGYSPRARFFPLIVISACGLLVLTELIKSLTGPKGGGSEEEQKKDEEAAGRENEKRRRFFAVIAWLGGFAIGLWLLGFVIGLPFFVFAYVKTHEKGWLWAFVLAAIMFVLVYAGFGILLETPLYEGWLFLE